MQEEQKQLSIHIWQSLIAARKALPKEKSNAIVADRHPCHHSSLICVEVLVLFST